ncbi:MAG: M23 family metallopeptidase [Oscillospiraceae bacterium]|nr:M23 family metallopeptidase [Oscillospiraceae bacterium]
MSKKKFSGNISGKGYYIALVLCAVAIGITGYFYYQNLSDTETPEGASVNVNNPVNTTPEMEVVATEGGKDDPAQPTTSNQKPAKRVKPVSGQTIAPYSMEALSYNETTRDWRVHDGMDIAAEAGTAVSAAAEGTVYAVYEDERMGMTVVICHTGDYVTEYASLAENVTVVPGDIVQAGQTIGYVGDTALLESAIGDHVHFSVSCGDEVIDPTEFLE